MFLQKLRFWIWHPKECFALAMKLLKKMKESGNNLKILMIMKKILLAAAAALTALVACQKNEVAAPAADSVLYATIEETDATKTYMDAHNNIRWSEGDQIVGFMKSSLGLKYRILSSSVGKTSAFFEKVSGGNDYVGAGTEWDHNVIYYPYSDAVEAEKSGNNYALNIVLPSEQTYASESFGNGSMAMVAVSEDNDITFRNVLGGMKLQLRGTQKVKSIKLEGKNNEKLSGAATVTAYADETKPAITMASGASKTITLNCGSGVQLNESTAIEFIVALPPVLFSKGFTVTVTDTESKTYKVETDKANTVLRSSLLVMPDFKLDASSGGDSGEDIVPVVKVAVSNTDLTLTTRFSYALTAKISPVDATDQSIVWSSDNSSVVTVDQSGVLTTLSSGTAVITAEAGGVTGTCTIKVIAPTTREVKNYEVDGVSYGKGIVIGDVIWAPVNCGYHPTDFKYGKLYQWGRKYGQGYKGKLHDGDYQNQIYSDASVPEIVEGPISAINGQKDIYSNTFFTTSESPYDWTSPQADNLWNSGTEDNPVKTEFDPCPEGWRVPTRNELDKLNNNSFWTTVGDQKGRYFSGDYTYLDNAPQVFFPAAGSRIGGDADFRGNYGRYWSSHPVNPDASYLYSKSSGPDMYRGSRANGLSVRCVQE